MHMYDNYEEFRNTFNKIMDCFDISKIQDEKDINTTKYIVQTAFYYRVASYITESCEKFTDMS